MKFKRILIFLLFIPISLSAIENISDTTKTKLDSLEYTAEKIIYDIKSDQIILIGNAEILYKKSFIKSDSILIDLKNRIAISEGQSELFDGEEIIYGSSLFFDIDSEEGMLLNGDTEFEGGLYSGERMRKVGDRTFDIDNARYTTCELNHPHYYIFSPKFRVFLNDKIVARPVILYVNHFPIFALPFASFPIKRERHSGFLIPDPGYNKTEGKTLKDLAYFQTLGDYGDILFALDFMELTGFEFRIRSRYLKRYFIQGNIISRLLYYRDPSEYQSVDKYRIRWSINSFHKQTLSPYSNLLIKADFVSDTDVRKTSEDKEVRMDKTLHSYLYYTQKKGTNNFNTTLDYKEELVDSNRTLYSKIYFSKRAGYINFNIYGDFRYYNDYKKGSSSKNKDKITLNLPSASFQMYQRRISQLFDKDKEEFANWWDNFYLSYNGYLIHKAVVNKQSPNFSELFFHDTYENDNIISQHREGIKHKISLIYESKILKVLKFYQYIKYNEIWADKDKDNNKLVRGYDYNSSTSASAPLYGIFTFNTKGLKAIRHIITPKVTYTMHPDFSKNDRFYSFAPITISKAGKSEKLSFSIVNKLQAKILDKSKKIKKLNNLFSLTSSFGYDFEKKPTGFSNIKHYGKIMTLNVETGPTRLNLNTNFSCTQDYPSLKMKDYSYKVYLDLFIGSDLSYFDYFPYHKFERNVNERPNPEKNISNSIEDIKILQKPWNLDMKFGYGNNKAGEYTADLHNHLQLYLTKNWSIDYKNYYNFKEHKLISQSINIYRDLHCWQLRFTWSKSGEYWSYRFQISAKKLPDLKFRHSDRKHW